MDREGSVQSDLIGMLAQQARTDRVERAGPAQRLAGRGGFAGHDLPRDPFDAPGHLGRRAPRERHQQDAPRIGAVNDQVGHAMGEGVGLPRAGPSDHEER